MKGKRRFRTIAFTTLLAIGLCFGSVQTVLAYTTVYLDLVDSLENSIASLQFEILEPDTVDVSDVSLFLPSGWIDFSVNRIVSAFDGTGEAPLPNGMIAAFDFDVILGNFEIGDQNGKVIPGDLYSILRNGSDYIISNNVVPIPSALILLGCGMAGIVGIRRRQMRN